MTEQIKLLRLRRTGVCSRCPTEVQAGTQAGWDRVGKVVVCLPCLEPAPTAGPALVEESLPGASLDREYARRRASREARVRNRFPRIGGVLLALTDEPATTKAFKAGAEGERAVAARLEKLGDGQALFLHNRRCGPGARSGDIDHLAVTPSGVYVVDAKHYANARIRVRRSGGIFSPAREQLMVNGRDRTKLLDSLDRQVEAVITALEDRAVPVSALLCFVGADLPLGRQEVRGVPLVGPRGASKRLRRPGPLEAEQCQAIWRHLAVGLPPA